MATFMPKPLFGVQGSGMHTHMSLFDGDNNAFYDDSDEYNLSAVARRFIAGVLAHARELTAVTNQWVNSYKRLIVGYEAPVYISWARNNRSALVRVPPTKKGKRDSTRIEYRAPDSGRQPLPGVRGRPGRRADRDREGLRAAGRGGRQPVRAVARPAPGRGDRCLARLAGRGRRRHGAFRADGRGARRARVRVVRA